MGMVRNLTFLFFDNPSAGNIYKKLGFEEIGKYLLIFNEK